MTDRPTVPPNSPPTIVVEFARLTEAQQAFVDLHTLRAIGTTLPVRTTDATLVEFWVRDGETPDGVYDDIRGWAIGNGLPIRGLIT